MSTTTGLRKNNTSVTQAAQASNKRQKVTSNASHPTGLPIHIDPSHAVAYDGKKMVIQEMMTPAPAEAVLSNTSQFSFIIENDSTGLIKDVVLRFDIEITGTDQQLMPVPLWFDRIEWYDRHSGREIGRIHGDMMWWLLQTLPQNLKDVLADPVNFCSRSGRESKLTHLTGSTARRFYYLPMPYSWIEGFDLDMSLLKGDLEIKFYPKGDCRQLATTGAASNVLLKEIRWVGNSEMFTQLARLQFRKDKALSVSQHNFIDVQQYTDVGRVYSPGQEYTIDLDQFHHESAFLVFCLRRSDANLSALDYIPLGPRGTIDHENVHGRSLFGDGTPVDEKYMRQFIASTLFPGTYTQCNAVYVIPFTNDIQGVLNGQVDGWHDFRGDRERIRIVTGAAPTKTSYTMTWTTNADAAGVTKLRYKGDSTANIDFTTVTAAELTTALNALPSVIEDGITFNITGATPNASFLVEVYERGTYNSASGGTVKGQPKEMKGTGIISAEVYGNASSGCTAGAVTQGVKGFVAGTYTVDIYSVYYRYVQQVGGRLFMNDL